MNQTLTDLAVEVLDRRTRQAMCPSSSPSWRSLAVEAEASWHRLFQGVGCSHAAADAELRRAQDSTR